MERLTAQAPNGMYYLSKIKPNEQSVEASKNTLECIVECFKRLGEYEDLGMSPEEIEHLKHRIKSLDK